jgi:hypothetical protein
MKRARDYWLQTLEFYSPPSSILGSFNDNPATRRRDVAARRTAVTSTLAAIDDFRNAACKNGLLV